FGYAPLAPPQVEKRFKALRFIATLIKIAAFVISGLIVIAGLFAMISGAAAGTAKNAPIEPSVGLAAMFTGVLGAIFLLVYAVFVFVFLYAYAEVIYLFLGIEENTRVTNEMLRNR